MDYVISEHKWVLLGFGLVNVVFLFTPIVYGDLYNYYIISLPEPWGIFLMLSMVYFLIIVPFNAIYSRIYTTDYYDTVIKAMNTIVPILGLIGLLFFKSISGLSASEPYSVFYYVILVLFILEYGWNYYLTYRYV